MKILIYPHTDLLKETEPLGPGQVTNLKEKIREMFNLMYASNGVGLAAPQIGWSVKLVVVNPRPPKRKGEIVLINPEIVAGHGTPIDSYEGCLSLPGINCFVKRYPAVSVKYYNENFEEYTTKFEGFKSETAKVIQHEIDHLNSILLIHRKMIPLGEDR